jgi:perosamine synthetase
MDHQLVKNFSKAIMDTTKNDNVPFLFFKGRVALYAILKSIGIEKGDEVILPSFTCVVVSNAIIYAGGVPVYVDIRLDSLTLDLDLLKLKISKRTKVIVCQNSFGLSWGNTQLLELREKYQFKIIEDCTHGFGGVFNDIPNGSMFDAVFYSTQWNKPFSTGVGGIAVVNNRYLAEKMEIVCKNLEKVPLIQKYSLKIQLFLYKYILSDKTYWILMEIYRFLSRHNIITGSSQGDELISLKMPIGFFKEMSDVQIKEGIVSLDNFEEVSCARKRSSAKYTSFLESRGKFFVNSKFKKNHIFLTYPVFVKNRDMIFEKAKREHVKLGDWFNSPLHPIQGDLNKWGLVRDDYPVSSIVSSHIINLSTKESDVEKTILFLESNLMELYCSSEMEELVAKKKQ